MGIVDVTVLHALGRGEPELTPLLEAKSSSLGHPHDYGAGIAPLR
jgi:hypothetical protein